MAPHTGETKRDVSLSPTYICHHECMLEAYLQDTLLYVYRSIQLKESHSFYRPVLEEIKKRAATMIECTRVEDDNMFMRAAYWMIFRCDA